ncbi:MAG: helix-turn-helix transcriptional regulator [Ruminococcaceae bacterium]|nr:helix-turn-helix transcriptional regulator [Oscillospiraceae bacterium]
MKLGEKIRLARLNAGMTQAELAGDFITRNMLSQIENGLAMPSLQTALYIADRLGVDAGILFSEGDNSGVYFLTRTLPELKKTFAEKEYDKCIDLCNEADELGDEAYLILAECYVRKAYDCYDKGKLRHALKFSESAIKNASKAFYSSDGIRLKVDILEAVISSVTPYLKQSKFRPEERKYLIDCFIEKSEKRHLYIKKNEIISVVENKKYKEALDLITDMLKENGLPFPLEYTLYCNLEICCRELKDFEGAYKYSQISKEMFEDMQM